MNEDLITAVREELEAFNEGDWDRFASMNTDDSIYEEPATGRRVQGRDALLELNRGWKDAFPDAHGTELESFASGDRVTIRLRWEGTQTGALPLPSGGVLPPSGKRISIEACQVTRIREGKVAESIHYFDMLGMFEQIGALEGELAGHAT